jgi:carbon monoxide dehydrogenase subunit G
MDMVGETFIAATRTQVWAGLNDPEILRACIPGCTGIEKLSDTEMRASAGIKLGPVAAKFQGKVTLSDLDPPNGYKITGEGQGGAAGFAKGGAVVRLTDRTDGTMLHYTVQAQVGGKIAQLGARLIDATAKSLAEQFFRKFAAAVEPPPAAEQPAPAPAAPEPVPAPRPRGWFAAAIAWLARLFAGKARDQA